MHINKKKIIVRAIAGGVFAGLSLSQGSFVLMPFAIALLWSVSKSYKGSFSWAFIAILISHRWLLALHPLDWIGINSLISFPLTFLIWLTCGFLGGMLVTSWALLGNYLNALFLDEKNIKQTTLYAIVMALIWGIAEVYLANLPLFWIGIGTSLLPGDLWLAGLARFFGAGGLATIQLIIGWWIWQIAIYYKNRIYSFKLYFIGILILLISHFIGWKALSVENHTKEIPIAIWQTSIPTREKFTNNSILQTRQQLQKSLVQSKDIGASLLIAPEGTLIKEKPLIQGAEVPLIIGGFKQDKLSTKNSLLFFDKGEKIFSRSIDKHRLVLIGEWLPNWLEYFSKGLSAVGGIDPGIASRYFTIPDHNLAAAICYEISDGISIRKAINKGGEWILTISNLDPYPLLLQKQFTYISQLRSIETARNLISSANTGPSLNINSNGKISELIEPFQEGIRLTQLNLNNQKTPYLKYGEIPLFLLLVVAIFGLILQNKLL